MSSTWLVIGGIVSGVIGIGIAAMGWRDLKLYNVLFTGTPTTDIQNINSEEKVEFEETISGPVDGSGFVSPIGQRDETVFAMWYVYEWKIGPNEKDRRAWSGVSSGMYSVPFYLDNGTDRIQVEVGNHPGDVMWKFGDAHVVEDVEEAADSPVDITSFVREHDLVDQRGLDYTIGDVGLDHVFSGLDSNTRGDRRYAEWTFGPGDEIYVLGHAHAANGATAPLRPEDTIVAPADKPFIITDQSKDEWEPLFNTNFRLVFAISAFAIILGAGLLVAGQTPLL